MQLSVRFATIGLRASRLLFPSLHKSVSAQIKIFFPLQRVQTRISRPLTTSSSCQNLFNVETRKEFTFDIEEMKGLAENDKVILVDVREPSEVSEGKVPAKRYINVPIGIFYPSMKGSKEDFEKKFGVKQPGKDDEIVLMCRGGLRSTFAMLVARDLGYANAKHFPGGWNGWVESLESM